jgi:hypothetical protein
VVSDLAVIAELRDQLSAQEKELDHREKLLLNREHDMVEAKRALGRARMECDSAHDQTGAVWQDYLARLCASTVGRRCSLEFDRVLSGHQFTLSVLETELERQEKELADDQAWGLYPPDRRDLPSELGKLRKHVAEVEDDHVVEVEQLSRLTMEISNALVDLNVMPIQGISSRPRLVKDVMAAFALVSELLCEQALAHEPDA